MPAPKKYSDELKVSAASCGSGILISAAPCTAHPTGQCVMFSRAEALSGCMNLLPPAMTTPTVRMPTGTCAR